MVAVVHRRPRLLQRQQQAYRLSIAIFAYPSEYRHPVWYGKTRMVWLHDGEKISKISLFVLTQSTNVTDTQTDRHTDTT